MSFVFIKFHNLLIFIIIMNLFVLIKFQFLFFIIKHLNFDLTVINSH